jgi:hypothetical protein
VVVEYTNQTPLFLLRAMISTHVEDKFRSQEITLEDQTFVQSGQTHSTATDKKHDVKKRKYVDGEVIQSIHQKVFPQPNDLAFNNPYDHVIDHLETPHWLGMIIGIIECEII